MKTAVDFLVDEFKQKLMGDNLPDWVLAIIDQAKEMEKEQIIDAWDDAYDKGTRDRLEKISNPVGNAEQYYNEKFMT